MIIYINGASSAGKSTLARWVQSHHEGPLFYYSIDCLLETMPADELARLRQSSKTQRIKWDNLWAAYFRSAAALADSGLDVILDCPLYDVRARLFNEHISPLRPLTVLLNCPVEELQRREVARGDRWVGLASYQAPRVITSIDHDLTFDSSSTDVDVMGRAILSRLVSANEKISRSPAD